jgi:hypothetical protein
VWLVSLVRAGESGLVLGLQLLTCRVVSPQRFASVDLGADVRLEFLLLLALFGDLGNRRPRDHQYSVPVADQDVAWIDRHAGTADRHVEIRDVGTWRLSPGRKAGPDPIDARWNARARFLPGVPHNVIRIPETIAMATLFTSRPPLLDLPRSRSRDYSPMQFLLAAALCLRHPAPD